jgi:hypothetical protein
VAGVQTVAGGQLVISEVMADPAEDGRDASYEWVELVNTGEGPVALDGWSLGDAKSASRIGGGVVVAPGGYVVVAGRDATFAPDVLVARVDEGEIGSGLNNDGDAVRLIDPGGAVVSAMSFGEDASVFAGPPAPDRGLTVGLRDAAAPADPASWAKTFRPTPGRPNEFPGEATATASAAPGGASPTPPPSPSIAAGGGDAAPSGGGDGGPDAAAWLVTGGAIGAGLVAGGLVVRRKWPDWKGVLRRGR